VWAPATPRTSPRRHTTQAHSLLSYHPLLSTQGSTIPSQFRCLLSKRLLKILSLPIAPKTPPTRRGRSRPTSFSRQLYERLWSLLGLSKLKRLCLHVQIILSRIQDIIPVKATGSLYQGLNAHRSQLCPVRRQNRHPIARLKGQSAPGPCNRAVIILHVPCSAPFPERAGCLSIQRCTETLVNLNRKGNDCDKDEAGSTRISSRLHEHDTVRVGRLTNSKHQPCPSILIVVITGDVS
jgi:hypothetical protein